jgi:hypothetical protein
MTPFIYTMKFLDSTRRKHDVPSAPEAAKEKAQANPERKEGNQASEDACRTSSPFGQG